MIGYNVRGAPPLAPAPPRLIAPVHLRLTPTRGHDQSNLV